MRKASFFIVLAVLFYSGCKPEVIEEEKFIKVYTDIVIMKDTLGMSTDSIKIKVFKRYSVSDKQYQNTLDEYNRDAEKWEAFFDKAIAYLENQKNKK